jgi:hypothetical protein
MQHINIYNITNHTNTRVWCYAPEPSSAAKRWELKLQESNITTIAYIVCLGVQYSILIFTILQTTLIYRSGAMP